MRWIVAAFLAVHGLIHLMGCAKASHVMAVAWLAAGLLVVSSAVMTVAWPRRFWIVGGVALVMSQAVIFSAWSDARAGTIANVVLLLAVAHSWFSVMRHHPSRVLCFGGGPACRIAMECARCDDLAPR